MRAEIDGAAKAAAVDRRSFLHGAGAVAASLAVFNLAACSRAKTGRAATPAASSSTSSSPGGSFVVPPPQDLPACERALSSQGEFIFDVHTHHVMPQGPWRHNAPDSVGLIEHMLPAGCTSGDPLVCVDRAAYLHDLFFSSDTTVAMLTDVPNSGPGDAPIPFVDAVGTGQAFADLAPGGAPRVLAQQVLAPNVGDVKATLDAMTANASGGQVSAFKVYTAWNPSGPGFSLTDPTLGLAVIQHAHDLGVRVFVAHKGLPLIHFDPSHNHPDDIVAASRLFPDMNFVVFHAAWDPNYREGPYRPQATIGIDSLLAALDRHGVPANDNVWVDLGTVWRQLLTDPTQAAHAVGKLLSRVGEHRVLWGTDAIWYGSPQPQIMAFRAFQISPDYQARFGYPALTDTRKRQIFGLNAATLFGVDPAAARCGLPTDPLNSKRPEVAQLQADGALRSPWSANGPTTRRQMLQWIASAAFPSQPV
jgi:hypothetical protein